MTVSYTNMPLFLFPGSKSCCLRPLLRQLFAAIAGREENRADRERKFREAIEEFGEVISGVCFSYASDADDLKDLRQDILINIWKGLVNFRGDSSLSTWIYRVALNTCVSTVRKRSRRPSTVPIETTSTAEDESDAETQDRIETLHGLISSLMPLDKAVVTMWLDERKYEEIAEVTGLSRNNVAVRINRIKQKLAERIKR